MVDYFQFIDKAKLDEKLNSVKFPFRQNLFWDCPAEKIDLKKHSRYVIERVLMRGFTDDFYMLQKIYSREIIQDALRKSKELDAKTAAFCSWYFKVPKNEIHVSSFYH